MNGIGVDELENNRIEGGTDGTEIGNTGDRLNTKDDPVDHNEMLCILRDIYKQLRVLTIHMQQLSDVELTPCDEDDEL